MNQTILKKYCETYGVRFGKRQKAKFEQAIIADFETLGYEHTNITGRKYVTKVNNILFGNIKRAKHVIVIPYDTPQRIFWWDSRFYPLDGLATTNHTVLPTFVPIIAIYLVIMMLVYGMERIVIDDIGARIALIIGMIAIIGLFYFMMRGIGNRKNYCRNSAGIVAAYEIAASLTKEQRRTTAFLFLDANKNRHYGAQFAAEYIQKQNKNPNIVILNTFAYGSNMQIGYNAQTKRLAQELGKSSSDPKRLKPVALNDDMRVSSPMDHFIKAVTIGAGEIDKKGRLCFNGSATGKDKFIDETNMEIVISAVSTYIKNQ